MQDSEAILVLSQLVNLSTPRLHLIFELYHSMVFAIDDNFAELKIRNVKWVKNSVLDSDNLSNIFKEKFIQIQTKLSLYNISWVTVVDPSYPIQLKDLNDYPSVLYYTGDLTILPQKFITVVGSRVASKYAKLLLDQILPDINRLGIGVVSGLALGIDTLAHQITLNNQAKTIAVIGGGLDKESFFPHQNWSIGNQIIDQSGLIMSEYPPETKPTSFSFPRRNRILAALTNLTWVVQAGKKSGSLLTAQESQKLGRIVCTSPGMITDESLLGNISLLKNGAKIITEYNDILSLLGVRNSPKREIDKVINFNSEIEKQIYLTLEAFPINIDSLASQLKQDTQYIQGYLSMLELNGLVENIGLNEWVKI